MDNPPDLKDWKSESDDVSDSKPGGNYLNIDLEGLNGDSTFDPVFMEEDGNCYDDFEWVLQPLTSNNKSNALSSMYNGPGHAMSRKMWWHGYRVFQMHYCKL